MPNEKNSADSAISPAVIAARGSSIMVPTLKSTSTPGLVLHLAGDVHDLLLDQVELPDRRDQRDHDLRPRVAAGLLAGDRGLEDRPGLHREQAGDHDAEPDAAQPEHRVLLVQPLDRGEQLALPLLRGARGRRPSAIATESSVRSGRNSCSGGSISRIVTGSPSIASRISSKSSRCSGQQRVERLLLPLLVVGDDQVLDQLAPLAEEHVLGAAQPDALGAEPPGAGGVLGGVGVGRAPRAGGRRRRARSAGRPPRPAGRRPWRRRRPRSSAPPASPRPGPRRRRPRRWCRRSR